MAYLLTLLLALALAGGFVALAEYEARRGARFFPARRAQLDAYVARLEFIWAHVDLPAFIRDEARRLAGQASHMVAAHTLAAVRAVERELTRAVRYLRTRHGIEPRPQGNAREFVKTLSDFKDRLKATRPEHPAFDGGGPGNTPA